MWEKIVQKVPVRRDPASDLIGLIDVIELELLIADDRSVRDRLSEIVDEVRESKGQLSETGIGALLDVIGRLEKIERLLSNAGFETGSRTE